MAPPKPHRADTFFSGVKTGPQAGPSSHPKSRASGKQHSSKQHGKPQPDSRNKGKGRETKPSVETQQELILANQALSTPPALSGYSALRKLDLSKTGITSLAFVKDVRSTLTWLNVSGNKLDTEEAWHGVQELSGLFVLNASECGLREVPSVVEVLHSLKALVITHNKLTQLDHIKRLVQLNTIVVSNNELTSLPASLATLPALKKLSCAHNQLTPAGLADLSALALLREVRFSHNPQLTSLPEHFASWGKADDGSTLKRSVGLEIVDLASCAFGSWYALRALAGQDGIHNLALVGNPVADAARADGFEAFQQKMNILLPALRVLDGHRFDAKFADLKKRREGRTEEQRIVEAGPMMLALNKQRDEPVLIPKQLLKDREIARKNKKRLEGVLRKEEQNYKKALREAVKQGVDPESVPRPKALLYAEQGFKKAEKEEADAEAKAEADADGEGSKADGEDVTEVDAAPAENEPAVEAAEAAEPEVKPKKERKRKAAAEGDAAEGEDGERKKKKNRHEKRREADSAAAAAPSTEQDATTSAGKQRKRKHKKTDDPAPAPAPAPAAEGEEPAAPRHRKRGRDAKNHPELVRKERALSPPRPKKKAGGVLADLRGDGSYVHAAKPAAPEAVPEPAAEPEAGQEQEQPKKESKAKTSVLKVVEVQKKKKGPEAERQPVDIMALFGERKDDAIGSGWD